MYIIIFIFLWQLQNFLIEWYYDIIVINKDRSISFGDSKIPLKEVQKKLKAIFETRKNKQVYIQADKNVDYGTVAQTMGEVRSAGIYQVGLITLPKMGL